ncbi:MAG: type II toxin-antitoxin system Y4mF family antitoxin [Bacteroidales bacterium]
MLNLYLKAYKMNLIAEFVKKRRKQLGLTQDEFAMKAGVALTVIRKIEQGKDSLSLSKVNQVLMMFGQVLGPVNEKELCDKPQ